MAIGQELLNVPMGDMIRQMAFAIAEGQVQLDASSIEVAEMMGGLKVVQDANGKQTFDDSRIFFGYELMTVKEAQAYIAADEAMTGGDKALAEICAKVLSKTGSHERCEAGGSDAKTCAGAPRKVVTLTDFQAALAGGEGYAPDTKVEGVIPGATRVATESLESAGSAISSSARKSWDCVASLFKDC